MSDIRTKLLMGTTISAVSLMLVMAISISAVQNDVPAAGTTLGLMGHFEIMVQNPDGTTSYTQADNFITGDAKDGVAALVFLGTAFPGGVPDCMRLGIGTPVITADGVNTALDVTGLACTGDGGGASAACDTAGATDAVDTAAICTMVVEHTMNVGDCSPTCTISEVEFGAGTSGNNQVLTNIFSYTALTGNVVANTGALVTTTYKIATGGVIV